MKPGAVLSILVLAACQPAKADTPAAAAEAFDACMNTIFDGAPLTHAPTAKVQIKRDTPLIGCTIRVLDGDAEAVREAVLARVTARPERFTEAKTRWDPRDYGRREMFCGGADKARTWNVLISTSKPNDPKTNVRLMATAMIPRDRTRDARCDKDLGLQPPLLKKSGQGV